MTAFKLARKRKKHPPRPPPYKSGGVRNEINVTPLVDVVLVLLIIFMVVTPLLEKDIAVRVPATEQVETQQEVPPEQVVVGIDAEGALFINTEKIDPLSLSRYDLPADQKNVQPKYGDVACKKLLED